MRGKSLLLGLAFLAGPLGAQTDLRNLTDAERDIFRGLIRETLLAHPDIVAPLVPPVAPAPDFYRDDINADLAAISAASASLFAPDKGGFGPLGAGRTIALFTAPDCPPCAGAEADLRRHADTMGFRVNLFDFAGKDAALAAELGIDSVPTYVLPDLMFRGGMPVALFSRYFEN